MYAFSAMIFGGVAIVIGFGIFYRLRQWLFRKAANDLFLRLAAAIERYQNLSRRYQQEFAEERRPFQRYAIELTLSDVDKNLTQTYGNLMLEPSGDLLELVERTLQDIEANLGQLEEALEKNFYYNPN